jgi:hypothetical protein
MPINDAFSPEIHPAVPRLYPLKIYKIFQAVHRLKQDMGPPIDIRKDALREAHCHWARAAALPFAPFKFGKI